MKRFWIGLILLAVLLALGIFTTVAMDRVHNSLSLELRQAGAAASEGSWLRAADLIRQANAHWERCRGAVAAAASHEPMEEIDTLFDQAQIYLEHRDQLGFVLCCASLRCRMQAMGEAHAISWWSLL